MELSCPFGTTRRVPQEKFPRKPYNKSFIDQACKVKMAGYWPRYLFIYLFCFFASHLVNNPYLVFRNLKQVYSTLVCDNTTVRNVFDLCVASQIKDVKKFLLI